MNIVYACDNSYAGIMAVSVTSLLENNRGEKSIRLYIIEDGISPGAMEKLRALSASYSRELSFIPAPDTDILSGVKVDAQNWSRVTFSRLFLAALLPGDIDRLLYLDCDTIIRGPLAGLYTESLEGCHAAGVMDCMSAGRRRNIELGAGGVYLNAGVLLIDLEKWRRDRVHERFAAYIALCGGTVPYVDQGVMNAVLAGCLRALPPAYNSLTAGFDFPSYRLLTAYRRPGRYYGEDFYALSLSEPVIVHFSASFLSKRPWSTGCKHPYAGEWQEYRALTPWKGEPPRKDSRPLWKRLAALAFRLMPTLFAANIAGFFHAVAVPFLVDLKRRIML